jgi:hypothetical protein
MSEPERQTVKVEQLDYLPEDSPSRDQVVWFGYIGFGLVIGSIFVGFAFLVLMVVWLLQ